MASKQNQFSESGTSPGRSSKRTFTVIPNPNKQSDSSPPATTNQKLLTPDDLAIRLGVSRLYIIRQAKLGKIPAIRIGKVWRFQTSSIDAWLSKEEREVA